MAIGQLETLEARSLLTTIVFDYSFDTSNFFDTQAKKDLLQTAADVLTSHLDDSLSAITPGPSGFGFDNTWTAIFSNPATGADEEINDLTIPADTILVYAGGRDLPGSTVGQGGAGGFSSSGTSDFNDLIAARGQAGALLTTPTDFGPWGGAITFDTATNWYFGLSTANLTSGETDFLSVAQHELGHLLGFGLSESWDALVSGSNFTGSASVASFGSNVPLHAGLSHWADGTTSNGQPTAMDPILTNGTRATFTALDYAGLDDIGWDVVQFDDGDAPDTDSGTGTGNYQTLATDNGPRHIIVSGIHLGASVDGDDGWQQNSTANADDQFSTGGADDEDGVLSPLDLLGTVGAAPTITLLATNTTGTAATLSGWIDFNADGVFDNATERAQIVVPDGTTDGRFTLTFPAIPEGSVGPTYARFRLSTDSAAADSTGAASDGEVEDYPFSITSPTDGMVDHSVKIASGTNGGPTLANRDYFGTSVAGVGDLDGDGVADLASGAIYDGTGGSNRGAVYVLLMNSNGTVKSSTKIASGTNGGPTLANFDYFGSSVAGVGDLDGDGVVDLAVGARGDDTGGANRGAVYVLLLNADGTVKSSTKIASGGGPTLADNDSFGRSVAGVGDLDGDGVADLAVGARDDDTGGDGRGAVHVLLMNSNGTVKSSKKIASGTNGGPTLANSDFFGSSVAGVGDLDGDGVVDLAVGARGDDTGGSNRGSAHVLLLNADGTVKSATKIASGSGGGPTLANLDYFGSSVAGVGDLDGDGVVDLAVGAEGDDTGEANCGAVHVLLLNADGTVKSSTKIASGTGGGPILANQDTFGSSVAGVGDLDGDGVTDLAVGAYYDDTGGDGRGAVHVLMLRGAESETPTLPGGGGSYEVLVDSRDVVLRVAGGAELLRRNAEFVTALTIAGSASADVITVLNSGTAFTTPLTINANDGNDSIDASLAGAGVTLDGGAGFDSLTGSEFTDSITGGADNDVLTGAAGNDTLDGGLGIDTLVEIQDFSMILSGSSAGATLQMTLVNGTVQATDSLTSIEQASLRGGLSNNRMDASGWNTAAITTLIGGGGRDTIIGSPGKDSISTFSSGRDSIQGGNGNDTIASGNGNDTVDGGDGDDLILGQGGSNNLTGGLGDDRVAGGDGADTLLGNGGNDKLFGFQDNDSLDGGDGNDSLLGSIGNDTLLGGAGKDLLSGDVGTDSIDGQAGTDRLTETGNFDAIIVGTTIQSVVLGNESPLRIERIDLIGFQVNFANLFDAHLATVPTQLTGNGGDDTLLGGAANDTINAGNGDDVISAGGGADALDGGDGTDFWFESANANFTVTGSQISSTATGTETATNIERIAIKGGTGNNNLNATATSIPVLLLGGTGNDTVLGGSGNDTLTGGFRGDSTVAGSDGIDSLDGGSGTDTLKNDSSDTLSNSAGDTLLSDVFSLLPSWLDLI